MKHIEIINTATGKSVGVYQNRRQAERWLTHPKYKAVPTDKPVNAWLVGSSFFLTN